MSTEGVHRKLAAILCADVEGYSRLMQDDPEGTLHTLTDHRQVFRRCTEHHEGRVVDSPGDNILIEFASAIEAVQCAVEIQRELAEKNAELADVRQMRFRIGIDLGDLLEKDDALYGDGVNISARLQSLAESGGICVSGRAYDQVVNRMPLKFEFLGKRSVKNIADPVRVYRVLTKIGDAMHDVVRAKPWVSRHWPEIAMVFAVVLIMFVGAGLIWQHYFRISKIEPMATEEIATPIQEKPSIAVLPFDDLSPEKDQGYFVDGLTEELLNSFAQIPGLNVTGRTSSFTFKGSNKKVQEIATELGVNHILEGSVRKAGNDLRITAQLLRGNDGFHLWSKTYDRELKEIFEVQEDIATAVTNELKVKLGIDTTPQRTFGGTDNVEAYELYLIALGQMNDWGKESLALESIDKALLLDPNFALAYATKSAIHHNINVNISAQKADAEKDAALSAALKAIEIEPSLADGYLSLGAARAMRGEWIDAEFAYRKGQDLSNEKMWQNFGSITFLYSSVGYFDKSHEILEAQHKADPLNKPVWGYYFLNFVNLGDTQRAIEEYNLGRSLFGDDWFWGDLFITQIRLGSNPKVSRADLPESPFFGPIWAAAIDHIDSPEDGIDELRLLYQNDNDKSSFDMGSISTWASYFGDIDLAMDSFEKACALDAQGIAHVWLSLFKEMRQTPRFKEFVREIGLVDYWNQFGWPDICRPLDNGDFVCD